LFQTQCELPGNGFWFRPTLFTNVQPSYSIAREEIFGPVLTTLTFRTPEEAVVFAFESVGFALIVMTIVISLGFLVLNLVNFMPLHDFARFSTISFVMALFIDFLLFPNLLVRFDKRKF